MALVAGLATARELWKKRQTTVSWAIGAEGERAVAARLAAVSSRGMTVLHDRRIPGSKANIDRIVVAPTGVYVIDAKSASGKVAVRTTGPIWDRGPRKLFVGGRDRSSFADGMVPQVTAVALAVQAVPWASAVPIRPMVALVGAGFGPFAQPLSVRGVWIGWPKELAKVVSKPGPLGPATPSSPLPTAAAPAPVPAPVVSPPPPPVPIATPPAVAAPPAVAPAPVVAADHPPAVNPKDKARGKKRGTRSTSLAAPGAPPPTAARPLAPWAPPAPSPAAQPSERW